MSMERRLSSGEPGLLHLTLISYRIIPFTVSSHHWVSPDRRQAEVVVRLQYLSGCSSHQAVSSPNIYLTLVICLNVFK